MRFVSTGLMGAWLVELEPHRDDRGLFSRTFCAKEFKQRGLVDNFVQCNTSWSAHRGTLRGLHFQLPPSAEAKLVRCTSGAVWDVIVDLRPDSPTFLQHIGVELSAVNRTALYVPEMFAHGFQTTTEGAEVFYQMSTFHAPELAAGLRHDDPKLGILWPLPVASIAEKDRSWPMVK